MSSKGSPTVIPAEVIHATEEEKQFQIRTLENLHQAKVKEVEQQVAVIQAAIQNQNILKN